MGYRAGGNGGDEFPGDVQGPLSTGKCTEMGRGTGFFFYDRCSGRGSASCSAVVCGNLAQTTAGRRRRRGGKCGRTSTHLHPTNGGVRNISINIYTYRYIYIHIYRYIYFFFKVHKAGISAMDFMFSLFLRACV